MSNVAISENEQKLLQYVFVREVRDGSPCFVYYNDEKYYLILSICEKYNISYRTKQNCIVIAQEEMKRILPGLMVSEGVSTVAPARPDVKPALKHEVAAPPHHLMQRFQPNRHTTATTTEKEDNLLVLREQVSMPQPAAEPKLQGLFPVRVSSPMVQPSAPMQAPMVHPAPIAALPPEPKSPSLDELLEQLTQQRQYTADTKQQSKDFRRQSLDAREQALLSREKAVNERERFIAEREEDIERRKAIAVSRLAEMEDEEQRIALLAQSFSQRRRALEQQRVMVATLQNHLQQVLNNGLSDVPPLAGQG